MQSHSALPLPPFLKSLSGTVATASLALAGLESSKQETVGVQKQVSLGAQRTGFRHALRAQTVRATLHPSEYCN